MPSAAKGRRLDERQRASPTVPELDPDAVRLYSRLNGTGFRIVEVVKVRNRGRAARRGSR